MRIWDLFKPKREETKNHTGLVIVTPPNREIEIVRIQTILEKAETFIAYQISGSFFIDELQEIVDVCHDIEAFYDKYRNEDFIQKISPIDGQVYNSIVNFLNYAADDTDGNNKYIEAGLKASIANLKEHLQYMKQMHDLIEKSYFNTDFQRLKGYLSIGDQLELNDRIANETESGDLDMDR